MTRLLYRIGRYAAVHRWRMIGAWVLLTALLVVGGSVLGGSTVDGFDLPGTESQQAIDLLDARFPAQSGSIARVVFHTDDGTLSDEPAASGVRSTLAEIATQPHVTDVTDLDGPEGSRFVSDDGTIAYAQVRYDVPARKAGTAAVDRLEQAGETARAAGVQVEYGGDVVRPNENRRPPSSELLGIGMAVIVLLVAFGSVIAMGLPLFSALIGLGIGLSLVTLLAGIIDVNSTGPLLATMIGLGVGIDYALFLVTRHRQFLHEGMTVAESAARANATSGSAVVFAGGTVVIAILGLQIAGLPIMTSMSVAAAVVVAVMVLVSVLLLPALLGLVGTRIDAFSLPGMRPRAEGHSTRETLGARWSRMVTRRPWISGTVALMALVILAIPLLSLRLGNPDDGTEPTSSTLRRSYDLLSEGFGPGFNGPLSIAVDLDGADPGTVDLLVDAVAADPGIATVNTPVVSPAGDAAVVTAVPTSKPQAAATGDLVHRLRRDVVPSVIADTGGQAFVGSASTVFLDLSDKVAARLPWFIAAVLVLSFLLLVLVFRSIVVPLKAALMNLLAIGAAYGVVVAVFQWGWLKDVVGLEETLPIISFVPMMMFAILFGLSMDYEVFILSRVREEWLSTGDSRQSVISGISATARVITSAAIIMISVFGAFMLGDDPLIKMFGLGLSAAVFIDATIVRMVLVPATMTLLGDANWWLPGWLDRLLPDLNIEGEAGLPLPEYEDGRGPDFPGRAPRAPALST